MPILDLKDQISRLPKQPGVYLYFNRAGQTIYVGRATSLRERVRSYLGAHGSSPKTDALLVEVARLEVILTDSVVEALALENNLIKQRSPRYNILLRDDKSYPYLQVTTNERAPRILVARRLARDGNFYAGPFLPATFARKTLSLSHKLFGIRSCNEVITGKRGRPCLEYDIKRCIAPCVDSLCSQTDYDRAVENAKMFLGGNNDALIRDLKVQMQRASNEEKYEQAGNLRDALRTIETLRDRKQKMATAKLGDRDAFGLKIGTAGAVIEVFQVRSGRVVERVELVSDEVEESQDQKVAVIRAALQQFYEVRDVPPEVHLPVQLDDRDAMERWLSARSGRRVRLRVPRRGDNRGLLELATRNAVLAYTSRYTENREIERAGLEELRTVLGLSSTPQRLECFDISTLQGAETVGAMVVSENGRMQRSEYRKYRILGLAQRDLNQTPSVLKPDDYAAMEEVVLRRYRRMLEEGGPFPDLVVIDGGKGQLTAAYKAFEQLGLSNLIAIGIAKREEEIFARGRQEPIVLPRRSLGLRLVQQIRDEAHRFAVTFHRRARVMRDLQSELDAVPGIGPKRRQALLEHFGSAANVRHATRQNLQRIVGSKIADTLIDHFAKRPVEG